jgi:hypothetical protein
MLNERMYYDKNGDSFDVNAPEVFDYDGADTVEKQWTQETSAHSFQYVSVFQPST